MKIDKLESEMSTMQNQQYQNILVGIDGSETSMRALDKAIDAAIRNQAKLYIAQVLKPQLSTVGRASMGFGVVETDIDDESRLKEQKQLLDDVVAQAKDKGVKDVTSIVKIGNPREELARNIQQAQKIDLIYIGATGANRVAQMFLGSNTTYILENSIADVMVVR
ncbi:universal stress protein [Pediococcus parvulus]|uniref:universal stress protein n=1 Tax=Pediococcus parvulus TaxID=54062 RepID=UPI00345EC820